MRKQLFALQYNCIACQYQMLPTMIAYHDHQLVFSKKGVPIISMAVNQWSYFAYEWNFSTIRLMVFFQRKFQYCSDNLINRRVEFMHHPHPPSIWATASGSHLVLQIIHLFTYSMVCQEGMSTAFCVTQLFHTWTCAVSGYRSPRSVKSLICTESQQA